MAKKTRAAVPPSSDGGRTTTVRVDPDLVQAAHFVCSRRKGRDGRPLKLGDFIDSILRRAIRHEEQIELERIRRGEC